jgi:hypothetical protein
VFTAHLAHPEYSPLIITNITGNWARPMVAYVKSMIFWIVKPCSSVEFYGYFEETARPIFVVEE